MLYLECEQIPQNVSDQKKIESNHIVQQRFSPRPIINPYKTNRPTNQLANEKQNTNYGRSLTRGAKRRPLLH